MSPSLLHSLSGLVLLLGALLSGCASPRSEIPLEETRIKNLAVLFGQYVSRNRGQSPANVEKLKEFARTLSPEQLKGVGIEGDLEKLFLSPRDNQPFVYRLIKDSKPSMGPGAVVFYEQTGKNGKRFVVYSTTQVEEVDAAKFKQLVPEAP